MASDGVEDVRGTFRHTLHPLTEQRKGVNPVRERPSKLIAEVAYIKVAPVSGCGDDQRLVCSFSKKCLHRHGPRKCWTGSALVLQPL
ncbi:hypothetical protein TNIN_121741 [Trichonephila inaurata madagascariensis]|uniref:Uncharacterized protein n=1 Tax=Trichonephila inaurata madagascariensis TaxID=2747483 RepID=A0A8X7BSD0_9ARAC|nr:hypothetical protein TNIN_121741 [Trichonephila inaurata madagascariensis]